MPDAFWHSYWWEPQIGIQLARTWKTWLSTRRWRPELQPANSARAVTNQRSLVFETFLFPKKRGKKDEKNTVATAQIPPRDVLKICRWFAKIIGCFKALKISADSFRVLKYRTQSLILIDCVLCFESNFMSTVNIFRASHSQPSVKRRNRTENKSKDVKKKNPPDVVRKCRRRRRRTRKVARQRTTNWRVRVRPKTGERQRMKISSRMHSQLPTDVPSFLLAKTPVRARVLELLAKDRVFNPNYFLFLNMFMNSSWTCSKDVQESGNIQIFATRIWTCSWTVHEQVG